MRFYKWHALSVQILYGFMNYTIFGFSVNEFEPFAPMTKISWNYKQGLWIFEVPWKYLSISLERWFWNMTNHERNKFEIRDSLKHFSNIWEVHLKRMLIFLMLFVYLLKHLPFDTHEFLYYFSINLYISQRRGPFIALSSSDKIKIDLVWRAKKENPIEFGGFNIFISPCTSQTTESKASMRAN